MNVKTFKKGVVLGVTILAICALSVPAAFAQAVPGGTLDPTTIPKYVTPLVIPPVMNDTTPNNGTQDNDYDIAVRQFQQQILPGGIWNTLNNRTDPFAPTTIWSYGPATDPLPDSTGLGGGAGIAPAPNSQFNYPAYTVENTVNTTTTVDWINDLVANPWPSATGGCGTVNEQTGDCNFISHILPIDQTLHWANPPGGLAARDSRGNDPTSYTGPVPIVTHVHGANVGPESDGYPEAWYLPDADGIPAGYATQGTLANGYGMAPNTFTGYAEFTYPNTQPSATIWYHDHTLGMTRNNVYAGPAGFWLIRESGGGETGLQSGTLPGPAPRPGEGLAKTNLPGTPANPGREEYREIPIVIQDRSFNGNGETLFYPANRAFFEGLGDGTGGNADAGLDIDFVPNSDISPIWNPEAFFNVMVVNGVSWPELEVAPAIYRFRLLNGCNSRFLNLSMFRLNKRGRLNKEIPFFQIGAEQSLLPSVVEIVTGKATPLIPGNATWDRVNGPFKDQALLMGLAERADVLVDFRGLKNGTIVRMINTAPDAPFGGFPDIPADPATSGQVMQFRVNSALLGVSPTDPGGATPATDPWNLVLSPVESVDTYPAGMPNINPTARDLALIEEESEVVCFIVNPNGTITQDTTATPDPNNLGTCLDNNNQLAASLPFAPKAAVLGINGALGAPTSTIPANNLGATVTLWSDPIETNPAFDATETWELWNHTVDGHPIHLHLVKFKVLNREPFIPDPLTGVPLLQGPVPAEADEAGWKDTVIAYPGEVTRLAATFDRAGLYVWHCHIVEHEDNEMMVPYCVNDANGDPGPGCAGL